MFLTSVPVAVSVGPLVQTYPCNALVRQLQCSFSFLKAIARSGRTQPFALPHWGWGLGDRSNGPSTGLGGGRGHEGIAQPHERVHAGQAGQCGPVLKPLSVLRELLTQVVACVQQRVEVRNSGVAGFGLWPVVVMGSGGIPECREPADGKAAWGAT